MGYDSLFDALADNDRVIICNSSNKCMFIVDYDKYEYTSSLWWSKIILFKNNVKCGEYVVGTCTEWFIDDNHQICIKP